MRKILTALVLFGSCAIVPSALAHQAYSVSGDGPVFVANAGKGALYARTLDGKPQSFEFDGATPFSLRVRLMVPDVAGQERDVQAVLLDRAAPDAGPVAELLPGNGSWDERVMDPKSGQAYLVGARIARELPAGTYEIRVTSPDNAGTYALAFGELNDEHPLPVMDGSGDLGTRNALVLGGILIAFALGILFHVRGHEAGPAPETGAAPETKPARKPAVRKAPAKKVAKKA